MEKLREIENNEVYKEILKDSFGGVMYNLDNVSKYDSKELLNLWNSLENVEREMAGGIMNGVFDFLKQ